jgi:hypothetical protein
MVNKKQKKRKMKQVKFHQLPLKKRYPTATLITEWKGLVGLENKDYYLNIELNHYSGYIEARKEKDGCRLMYYLSTHTFYKSQFKQSTHMLQKYGFNVILANWD